ncbi:MAG TPA: porphobilinogen synthase [Fibrobacteraceae bacterium]|nr:porphobilinogen synthase [Fibrobacteraceae bacterium]
MTQSTPGAIRPRRLRRTESIRDLVREYSLSIHDLVQPYFVVEGLAHKEPVPAMPGVFRFPIDELVKEAKQAYDLGIRAFLLFGIPAKKNPQGSEAWNPDGIVQQALRALRTEFPDALLITDVCLCEYTSHGHCGVLENGCVLNDATLPLLAKTAVSHAQAGADWVAPSDMMDGRVAAIRAALDQEGFSDTAILSYSVKYASAYYGPFREAAGSAPQSGDRKAYQMDPANAREALHEAELDEKEGADLLMVKPALAYLDILQSVVQSSNLPVVAYNVSGEYSMVKAAAQQGWIDERRIVLETLTGFKRAGARLIITYHATDTAKWLQEN